MPKIHTDPEVVWKVWRWCCEAFAKHGRILAFPEGTDPQKTYQWRYVSRLARRLEEWDFDDQTSQTFIRSIAEYVRERKLYHKGMSVFFQANILQICYERVVAQDDENDERLESLRASRHFLDAKLRGDSLYEMLIDRPRLDADANIVRWFRDGKISLWYLALSKSCVRAMAKLAKVMPKQRCLLPKQSDLYFARSEVVDDVVVNNKPKPF